MRRRNRCARPPPGERFELLADRRRSGETNRFDRPAESGEDHARRIAAIENRVDADFRVGAPGRAHDFGEPGGARIAGRGGPAREADAGAQRLRRAASGERVVEAVNDDGWRVSDHRGRLDGAPRPINGFRPAD